MQVFKIFTTEKKNKSTLLNILGVQPLRTFVAYILQSRKRVSLDIALPQNTKQMIDKNGYLKLDDFIDLTYTSFWKRELDLESEDVIVGILEKLEMDKQKELR